MARAFERRMVPYLRDHFPARCRALGGRRLAALVHRGVALARRHGFDRERDISRYLALMLALGPRFDRAKRYPWAARILHDPTFATPAERMDVLYAEASRHLAEARASRPMAHDRRAVAVG